MDRTKARRELAALVRQFREATNLSQSDMAERIGIKQWSISAFETGRNLLSQANFVKYIDACGISGVERAKALKLYNTARRWT